MSYIDGMAAINLEMPERIPRTEYSVESHWKLVKVVTGIAVDESSSKEIQKQAQNAFVKAWNYDFVFGTLTHYKTFGDLWTRMGHAVYASGGVDFNESVDCPFKEPEEVLSFDPMKAYGYADSKKLTALYEKHYKDKCRDFPDAVNMTGIYITLISGLLGIFGWDMLLTAAGMDADGFGRVADRYSAWIKQYFEALANSDVPIVMIHDDIVWTSGAFIHPDWYRKYVFPNYKKCFAPIIESGKKKMYCSDGDYTQFIDDIADCGVYGFVMEPTTDMKYVAENYGKTHVIVGNADTRILLNGSKQQIYDEVKRCIDIGKSCPGYFMAVGNHIPSNTPVENALYYNEVYEKFSRR